MPEDGFMMIVQAAEQGGQLDGALLKEPTESPSLSRISLVIPHYYRDDI